MTRILKAFEPIARNNAERLVLGSMPGVASLDAHQYYAHPRNAFWPVVTTVLKSEAATYEQRVELLVTRKIAVWDVLSECQRSGSLDSNIRSKSVVCNDFEQFFSIHVHIKHILFNGKTAEQLFRKRVLPEISNSERFQFHALPSTSPAMASLNLDEKILIWSEALTVS